MWYGDVVPRGDGLMSSSLEGFPCTVTIYEVVKIARVYYHLVLIMNERERECQIDVAHLVVRLPNGGQVVMGSTPTFHSGI